MSLGSRHCWTGWGDIRSKRWTLGFQGSCWFWGEDRGDDEGGWLGWGGQEVELTVLFVLLSSRVVSVFGETCSRGTRLLLRHRGAELQRRRAVDRGPSQLDLDLDLDLDLGLRWLNLLLWGK